MALISAAAFKTQMDAAATAFTAAYKDTVESSAALVVADANHPLRRIEMLFALDPITGIVTTDTVYIDDAYAGTIKAKRNPFDIAMGFDGALNTATVEDAADTLIVLTYPSNLDPNSKPAVGDFVVGGTQSFAITNVAIAGAVLTLTSASSFIVTDTITISYTAPANKPLTLLKDREIIANLVAQAVTNNVV